MHFRVTGPQPGLRATQLMLAGNVVAGLLTILLAVSLVHWRVGATAADLGWSPRKLLADVGLGLATFVAISVPIFVAQFVLKRSLPEDIAPDPLTLFFLALVLGMLYYRTHRITPSLVVHAALNATSVILARWGG